MIREINVSEITAAVKEMCIQANHFLSPDMDKALKAATANEESPLGKKILNQLQENLKIAGEDMIPICQDTGMAVFFIEIGQDVHFTGGVLEDAINEGVRQGYTDGYLRKSTNWQVRFQVLRARKDDGMAPADHEQVISYLSIHFNIL